MKNLMEFKLSSEYQPTGDQPEAIEKITRLLKQNNKHVTLWGVTGSGKTFTMANVIERLNRPTLVLSHNKTLAAQLYSEFKAFFPENSVQYFVSYYDYYQPEAYLPTTDTYIEKDLAINDEIEKMRLSATSALLSGRSDVIVVSSVSCLYGIGNPEDFQATTIELKVGERKSRIKLLNELTDALYSRSEIEFSRGQFRVKGDSVDINIAYGDDAYRIVFFEDTIEEIAVIDPQSGARLENLDKVTIRPANIFVTTKERINYAISNIQDDLTERYNELIAQGKEMEAKRLKGRTEYDLEMIREVGYCPGIENYSRYFDGRKAGTRPFCLLDYFPKDMLLFIDESHVTIPQIKAMYGGDLSRKTTLVDYGFRLPAAKDNRPLKFEEFETLINQTVYVSATPADYELIKSEGEVVEQFIRPTGLLDPEIIVKRTKNQIDVILEEVRQCAEAGERVLLTTLTKRMAEELNNYMDKHGVRCRYIHSDVDNMERIALLEEFRKGLFDLLIGVNLLREGLDLPEVALVIIMDADKEGFLRTDKALTQTAGRAARNINGRVIMFADSYTPAMKRTIEETNRRRAKQQRYNEEHGITPRATVRASNTSMLNGQRIREEEEKPIIDYSTLQQISVEMAAEKGNDYTVTNVERIKEDIEGARKRMEAAAKVLDFLKAAEERDKMLALQELLKPTKKKK